MDKIEKALKKLSNKQRNKIKTVLKKLSSGETQDLDIKKLKNRDDIYRIRVGDLRLIYRKDGRGNLFVLAVARRNEKTYSTI